MRTSRYLTAAALIIGFAVRPGFAAQRHVVDPAAIASAVQSHVAAQEANRTEVVEALGRPEVQQVARKAGIDLDQLENAVATLSASDLERIAASAQDVNRTLVGGASTITLSTTTIIIGLLILILLIVALD